MKTVDLRTKEQKRADRKNALRNGWNAVAGFVRDNYDVLIVVAPIVVTTVGGACKVASKAIANNTIDKEIRYKERTIYDRSLGRYTELKRPMTARESLEFEERRANGERVNTILDDMRLLKK